MEILTKETLTREDVENVPLTEKEVTIAWYGDAWHKRFTGKLVRSVRQEPRKMYTVYDVNNTPVVSLSDLQPVLDRYNSMKPDDKPVISIPD